MADPRFGGQADVKAVVKTPGWFSLEHVNEISGGSDYADDMPGRANDSRWLEFYAATAESIQSPDLARFYLKMNGAAQTSMEGSAVHAEMYDEVTGALVSAQAIHAETKMGVGATGVSDYLTALRGILTLDADTKTLTGGAYSAVYLTLSIGTGITMSSDCSFIQVSDEGAVNGGYLLDSQGVASQAAGIWEADTGAVGTPLGYYKVLTAAGAGYLVVYGSHA